MLFAFFLLLMMMMMMIRKWQGAGDHARMGYPRCRKVKETRRVTQGKTGARVEDHT